MSTMSTESNAALSSTPARLVLRGARCGKDVAIRCGKIEAVGSVPPAPGDEVIDCSGDILTPGLINTHHHLYQWMTRGRAVGCDLFSWLTALYPVWGRLEVEDVAAAARVGIAELALSGASTVFDHHYVVPRGDDSVFDVIVQAAAEVGVRLHLSRGSMDLGESAGGLPPDHLVEELDDIGASTERLASQYHDGEWVSIVVAPCSPFSVSTELMVSSAELARRNGLRMHTHLVETIEEQQHCIERFGRRPVEVLESWGWMHDDVWLAHGIHLDNEEISKLAAAGVGVAHCPSSNARLAAGMCPAVQLRAAGAAVGLGVDGVASNEVGGLFPEMRQALYTARLREGRADALMPSDVLEMATLDGAKCLGRSHDLGRLEPGMSADVAVWPADDLGDIAKDATALILGRERRVRHLYAGGRAVVLDGEVLGLNLRKAHAELARRAQRLHD